MDKALGKSLRLKSGLEKSESMDSFKIIYQKNRNEKKPVKTPFEILSNYQQFFEGDTVKSYSEKLKSKKT